MSPKQTKRVMKALDDILQPFSNRVNDEFIEYALANSPHSDMGWSGRVVYDMAFALKYYKEKYECAISSHTDPLDVLSSTGLV